MKENFLLLLFFLAIDSKKVSKEAPLVAEFRVYGFDLSIHLHKFIQIYGSYNRTGEGLTFIFSNKAVNKPETIYEIAFLTQKKKVYQEWVDFNGSRHKKTEDTNYYFQNGRYTMIFNLTKNHWVTLNAAGQIFFDEKISHQNITDFEMFEVTNGSTTVIDVKILDEKDWSFDLY